MASAMTVHILLILMVMFCSSPASTMEIDEIIEHAAESSNKHQRGQPGHVRSIDRVIDQVKQFLRRESNTEQKDMQTSQMKRVEIDEIIEDAAHPAQKKNDKIHPIDKTIVHARQMSEIGNGKAVKRSLGSDYTSEQLRYLSQEAGDKCEVVDELDIVVSCEEYLAILEANENDSVKKRGRVSSTSYIWPTDSAINYSFDPQGEFSDHDKAVVRVAMDEIERYTCLTFKLVDDADESIAHRIRFFKDTGCYSSVGMVVRWSGYQDLSLGYGCREKGVVVHELLHALGMWHEQNRPDRDDYVTIHNENVVENQAHNFMKIPNDNVEHFGIPYDYTSIMHYGQYYFSKDQGNLKTIETKDPAFQDVIGNRGGLSFLDIRTLALMYQCKPASCDKTHDSCPDGGFVDENCRCLCESEHEGSRVKLCSTSSGSQDTCLLGDYESFEFEGKVASCTEHIANNHGALHRICSDSDLRKHCCKTCADNKKADKPGCEFGDKEDWCATLTPDECYHGHNAELCCDTCAKANTGIEGCEFGDKRDWCATLTPDECYHNAEVCCDTCAKANTGIEGCEFGDKSAWCATLKPHECYANDGQCCDTCAKALTGIEECPYGDKADSCKKMIEEHGMEMICNLNAESCCLSCGEQGAGKREEKSDALLLEYLKRLLRD